MEHDTRLVGSVLLAFVLAVVILALAGCDDRATELPAAYYGKRVCVGGVMYEKFSWAHERPIWLIDGDEDSPEVCVPPSLLRE